MIEKQWTKHRLCNSVYIFKYFYWLKPQELTNKIDYTTNYKCNKTFMYKK